MEGNLRKMTWKIGPKKVCKIEAKVSQNGAKMGATNRQHFEKYQKKGIQKSMRKKGAERTVLYQVISRTRNGRVANPGQRGRDLGRGSFGSFFVLGWFSNYLTRPAARWVRRMFFDKMATWASQVRLIL